jgi:hypothetical protein
MLFKYHTRAWMLKRLDAKLAIVSGPQAEVPFTSLRTWAGFSWILALSGGMLLASTSFAAAQTPQKTPQMSTASGAAVAGHPTAASAKKTSSTGKSTTAKTTATPHRVHHAARHRHAKPIAPPVVAAPAPPPPPVHPADQPANPATVDFRQGILSVHAQNSSLVTILNQISRETGLVVEGVSHDERMYGQYGPGNISSTLTALLDGAGYDYVIIGGADHSPTRLVLSIGGAAAISSPAMGSNQPAPVAAEQAEPADPTAPPQPKTPQEIFNEMRRAHPH